MIWRSVMCGAIILSVASSAWAVYVVGRRGVNGEVEK
jgi:hypothetical protein